jgi:hypothetical protein
MDINYQRNTQVWVSVQTFQLRHANQDQAQGAGSVPPPGPCPGEVEAMRGNAVIEADTYHKRTETAMDLHRNVG